MLVSLGYEKIMLIFNLIQVSIIIIYTIVIFNWGEGIHLSNYTS